MLWILLAILAHVGNGLVFIVDKSLLGTKNSEISKPIQYALYSAALAGMVVVLFPFARMQFGLFLVAWGLIAGAVHIGALYLFFSAMRAGEPSRVVPIAGSAVPFFTVILAVLFLGEVFTLKQGAGIFLLLIGGWMLALRRLTPSNSLLKRGRERSIPPLFKGRLGGVRVVMLPILAGLLFAAYFAITKYIYSNVTGQFFGIFLTTRLAEAVIAIIGIGLLAVPPLFKGRLGGVSRARRKSTPSNSPLKRGRVPIIFASNKLLAAGIFLLQTYAISLGSVSVVNALQGVQYALVLLLAIIISLFFPKLFREEIGKGAVLQKIIGIVLVSFGVALLV
jgi:drug/metabolite transporter (DMT)-like permease